jgi:hypothetical protein
MLRKMDLHAANATPSAPRSHSWKRSPQARLDIELFATRQEAEARVDHWHGLGLRHIWLHEVSDVRAIDWRDGAALETALNPDSDGVIYVIVKVD